MTSPADDNQQSKRSMIVKHGNGVCREQERIAKAEAARRETERILREQQAEVDAKKADMVKRDIQREKVSSTYCPCSVQSLSCSSNAIY